MKVSEQFSKMVRRVIVSLLLTIVAIVVYQSLPPNRAHAQNGGNVGIYTKEITVFTAQASSTSSAIFPDFGFAANYLTYCNVAFGGTVDLEWEPPGSSTYIQLAQASYGAISTDSQCHTLQVGGYFPNLRSTVTVTAGSINAWYTASSAPIPFVSAGIGSNGPSSPINCDQNFAEGIPTSGSVGGIQPIHTGDTVVICNFTVSFNGATSAGNIQLEWATVISCTGTLAAEWFSYTTSSTPQFFAVPQQQRSPGLSTADPYPCIVNNSGATAFVNISWASVHGL